MYLRRLHISNVRSIKDFELRLSADECAGWHVVLGANGAGKSSVVRSIALALVGSDEAPGLRQNWNHWLSFGSAHGGIRLEIGTESQDVSVFQPHKLESEIKFERTEAKPVVLRGDGPAVAEGSVSGFFAASFGPFRRFAGGDRTPLWESNPLLAPHLSAFEDVALTEGLRWLRELHVKNLEHSGDPGELLNRLKAFLNKSRLLPHDAQVLEVNSEEVLIADAVGARVPVEQMSDGFRSVLSMIFEILRQMTLAYGIQTVIDAIDVQSTQIGLPGIVAIDEVDAHLHPSWQVEIGPWFKACFPRLQFIVTTHSPIICRNATSVWRLAEPGSDELSARVDGTALKRLIFGSILEAYGTDLFGHDVARSEDSKAKLGEMAALNRKALKGTLAQHDARRLDELRRTLPTRSADLA